MRVFILSIFSMILLASCKPASGSDSDSSNAGGDAKALEDQVMALHDKIMPYMNDINDLGNRLRDVKAGITEDENGKVNMPDGLEEVMDNLKLAEQGMWEWMKSYSDAKPTVPEDQLKSFMEKQLAILQKVEGDLNQSMEKAKAWLDAHPTTK